MPIITKEQLKTREEASQVKIIKWAGNSHKSREVYNLTNEQAISIGSLGKTFKPKVVAEVTGVSVDCVRDLRNGKRGSSGFKPELQEAVDKAAISKKEQVKELAVDKLLSSLGLLSDEKLENLDGRDLSAAAANISRIVNNLEDKGSNGNGSSTQVNVVLYQPKPLREDHFEVVDI